MGGTLHRCQDATANHASRVIVMLETTGISNADRNIDVKYSDLEYQINGSWIGTENMRTFEPFDYTVTTPDNNRKLNAFLAPLD